MFDELSSRFEDAVKGLRGEAKISENNINDALNQVKRALLDADVSLSVVKEFISDVKAKAVGEEVVRGVNPGQKFIEVVNKELINIMGNENSPLNENENSPTVILMAGLQGAGKTTATGKLGLYLKKKIKKFFWLLQIFIDQQLWSSLKHWEVNMIWRFFQLNKKIANQKR